MADEFELNLAGERLDYDSLLEDTRRLSMGLRLTCLAWGSNV